MSKKEDLPLTKVEYQRIFQRCRWRALRIAKLTNPNDIKVFVAECMIEEKDANRQSKLTKDERLRRPLKLIVKRKTHENKPRKHVIIYQNVTPSKSDPVLTDFFIDPNKIPKSGKEELNEFMKKHGKVDYETVLKKIKELSENE